MAECLVALDCIADGIDHLNPDLVTDVGTVFLTDHKSDQGRTLVVIIPHGNDRSVNLPLHGFCDRRASVKDVASPLNSQSVDLERMSVLVILPGSPHHLLLH